MKQHWSTRPENAAKKKRWLSNMSRGKRAARRGKTAPRPRTTRTPVETDTHGSLIEAATYAAGYLTAWLEGFCRREGVPAGPVTQIVGRTLSRPARG